MSTSKELFDAIGRAQVFSTLDFRSRYNQLPSNNSRFEDKVKTILEGVNDDGRDMLFY